MFTTLLHHPVPGQGLGGRESLFLLCKWAKKNQPKKLSPVPPLGEARGGGWRVHSSLKLEGRRPASILAGRAVDFRRLAASRHRSFPCSTHSCLDFTRVHITVYQRGSIFFPLLFFCTLLSTSQTVPAKTNAGFVLHCSGTEGGREEEVTRVPPPVLIHLQRDFQGMGLAMGAGGGTVASAHPKEGAGVGPASQQWVPPDHQEVLRCLAKENVCAGELKSIQAWEKRRVLVSPSS